MEIIKFASAEFLSSIYSDIYENTVGLFDQSDLENSVKNLREKFQIEQEKIHTQWQQYQQVSTLYENLTDKYKKIAFEFDSVFNLHPKLLENPNNIPLPVSIALGISTLGVLGLAWYSGRISTKLAQELAQGFELSVIGAPGMLRMGDIFRLESRALKWGRIAKLTKLLGAALIVFDVVLAMKSLVDQKNYLKEQKTELEKTVKEIESEIAELNNMMKDVISGLVTLTKVFPEKNTTTLTFEKSGTEEINVTDIFEENFFGIKDQEKFEEFKKIMNLRAAELMEKVAKFSGDIKTACKLLRQTRDVNLVKSVINIPNEIVDILIVNLDQLNDCNKIKVYIGETGKIQIETNS